MAKPEEAIYAAQRGSGKPIDKDQLLGELIHQFNVNAESITQLRQALSGYLESIEALLNYADGLRRAKKRKEADEVMAILDKFINNYKQLSEAVSRSERIMR